MTIKKTVKKINISQRSDKLKNQTAIIKEIVKDPMLSQRQIAEKTWLWKTTVQEHLQDIPKATKSDRIKKILDKDLEIVDLALTEISRRLTEQPEELLMRDVIASADVSAKRYTLLQGSATDDEWWLKEPIIVQWMDIGDLVRVFNQKIGK